MAKFTGFGKWIEIFKGGTQVDSKGREHDGDALIDKAVSTFNAADHEPPAVVGHPKDNAPAFAWVEGVKKVARDGKNVLLAKFRDVVPEFEEAVKQGLYKKRSASFYPDGRLKHVGFLGAAPPAVKGLENIKFEAGEEAITFDFYDRGLGSLAMIMRRLREWFVEKEGVEKADAIIPEWDVENIRAESHKKTTETEPVPSFSGAPSITVVADPATKETEEAMSNFKDKVKNFLEFMGVDMSKVPEDALPDAIPEGAAASAFTEADIEAAKNEAAATARKEAEAEFAEKEAQRQREAREGEISDWCEGLVDKGRIVPAWMKMGLKEFCLSLDAEEEVEFSEGDKSTGLDWFKNFIAELPKVVDFKEIADRKIDVKTGGAAAKLDKLVREKMSKNSELDYGAAFSEVQRENPDLADEYRQEISPGE